MRRTIAIIGASPDRSKFGNRAVRAYLQQGWEVYPVHPTALQIEGQTSYPSIKDVPASTLERVSLYLPPARGLGVINEVAEKSVGEVWLNPGAESEELLEKGQALGLKMIAGCSIVDIGVSPYQLD
jgi:predicted CoA-binding protein